MCLFAKSISSWVKCLLSLFVVVVALCIGLLIFFLLNFESSFYILSMSLFFFLIKLVICKCVLLVCVLLFYSLLSVIHEAENCDFRNVSLSIYSFMDHAFGIASVKSLLSLKPKRLSPTFF